MESSSDAVSAERPPVRQLSRPQRRVLGVLVEKAFTTPEYYPLTLKAATAGCNQKSNRSPITHYSEDAVEEALDELRKLGLAAVVHTESGRTERYRHFMRQRYPFSETQLAIITELLLRGRQQLGELRSRASRMVPIEGLDELRADLQELLDQGYVQASGPLERRGVEVDHAFYEPHEEAAKMAAAPTSSSDDDEEQAVAAPSFAAERSTRPASPINDDRIALLERNWADLQAELRETRQEVDSLRNQVTRLSDELSDLRRDLGA